MRAARLTPSRPFLKVNMNKYQKQRIIFFIVACVLIVFVGVMAAWASKPKETYIRIFNPTSYNVSLELKCDWSNKIRRFKYHKFYTLRGNSSVNVLVPRRHSCQLWPGLK